MIHVNHMYLNLSLTQNRSVKRMGVFMSDCTRCHKEKVGDGYKMCSKCRRKNREWKRKRKQQSECFDCGKGKGTSPTLCCHACNEKRRLADRAKRKKLQDAGLCVNCGRSFVLNGHVRCAPCLEKGTASSNQARKRRSQIWSAQGGCVRCGEQKLEHGRVCITCWYKRKSQRATGTECHWEELKRMLENQDFKCIFTGRKLTPGINASVDHGIPTARGGAQEVYNLQWVDLEVNMFKRAKTSSEFLVLIKEIYEHWFAH